ncbi:hypothetical protein SAMN05216474_2971 [Lishizhenia tianjinensis]|uniref:Uncharacterized protein n=1 Tax=Lishizhenia tianjinensis TaxID=477690 RepID=A0A1I7BPG9_9FLAO|nr:DUF6155 family protein [Lishizhenia tianjinensis]SFT89100.1 hypothetical protein SAMN05216474_2971 [Lishizhenia tianjinensis]
MSKAKLKKHLQELNEEQLREQIIELYEKFAPVKTYFNFAFNPREDKLIEDARVKISKEYFPTTKRRAKLRRTTATKLIKHFQSLEMSPDKVADIMLYAIEVAQTYTSTYTLRNDNFFVGMFRQYEEALQWISGNNLMHIFKPRLERIVEEAWEQDWFNRTAFQDMAP